MEHDEVRVVVVDEMPDLVETLALALEMDGYIVRTASSGGEALEIIEEFTPLCVLLDIHMPGLGGHELSDRLRKQHGDDIVLIAVTGTGQVEDRVSATYARFDHCLRKPVDLRLLRTMLPPLGRPSVRL
jgi:DNA-binding response OmpR family regulator